MTNQIAVQPTDLRDYLKSQGWNLVKEAAKGRRLYVMSNPKHALRQLVFPMDTTAPDYCESAMLVVDKLAGMEGRSQEAIVKSLREVGDDSLGFRVTSLQSDEPYLPLAFAGSMVSGVQQLLLASACTVLKPQAHHPRLSRAEAQQLVDSAKFRHTEPGSFVLNVTCPVHALDVQAPLLPNEVDAPFVRRAVLTMQQSVQALVTAIETDSLDELIAASQRGERAGVSSNLCEALTRFEEPSIKNSIEIGITWATSIPRPPNEPPRSIIRIQHDYFSRIEEVRRELRPNHQLVEDVFPATVERLDGEMGPNGHRLGEVILSLLSPEGELVRARAHLDAEQYKRADTAHMTEGAYVKVSGKLHPGRQPRRLSEINMFELMLN